MVDFVNFPCGLPVGVARFLPRTYKATLTPAIVGANTSNEQTFAVPGLTTNDMILDVNKPTHQAGLSIGNVRVSAAGTIAIQFVNNTAAGITPTAGEQYLICAQDALSA
jgi:hypothetical protein